MTSMSPVEIADVLEVAQAMRAPDVDETMASIGRPPVEALLASIDISAQAWTLRVDGKVLGIWGVVDTGLMVGEGIPWLLTTHEVDRHPKEFFQASVAVIKMLKSKYALMSNYVDARHDKALRWAKRIGFEVSSAAPFGVEQRPFHRIDLRGDDHV